MKGYFLKYTPHRTTLFLLTLSITFSLLSRAGTLPPGHTQSEANQTAVAAQNPLSRHQGANNECEYNVIVYLGGQNNLYPYGPYNMKQAAKLGSNKNVNFLVYLDLYTEKEIQLVEIHKDNIKVVQKLERTPKNATGTPFSLYSCLKWAITQYPAKRQALVLWNHGSGPLEPHRWGRSTPQRFFNPGKRGICFNNAYSEYLTCQDLAATLELASQELLGGKKFDVVGMDACVMAGVAVAEELKNVADLIVFSQDVELAPGWNYQLCFDQAVQKPLSPIDFCKNIVEGYRKEYAYITGDFTLSTVETRTFGKLYDNIDAVSKQLVTLLKGPERNNLLALLRRIRTREKTTTSFYDNNYIDLHHFYLSLFTALRNTAKSDSYDSLLSLINDGIKALETTVIHNTAGVSLPHARGLSIYFPTRWMHSSYPKTNFGANNAWKNFIEEYLGIAF